MTSQPSASAANSAATASSSQSYLLAPLQSSTSSNVPITPSKARKQAQAQRTRLVALSKHLMTRLQYANFKVEHGWSKQSLSEVENLYYRQHQSSSTTSASTTTTATTARKSASTSPNNKAPVTPGIVAPVQTQHSVGSRLFKDAAVKKIDVEGGDVFGGYGLATPPASAGSVPGATSYLTSKRGRSTSSTPISPPNTSSNSSATKPVPAANSASKRSPNGSTAPRTATTAGGATSYADFWNRVGSSSSSTTTAAATNTTTAGSRPISPTKKRSADEVIASDATTEHQQQGPTLAPTAAAALTSPNKRVRMENDTTSSSTSNSPAKAALAERGPSFAASSARRH